MWKQELILARVTPTANRQSMRNKLNCGFGEHDRIPFTVTMSRCLSASFGMYWAYLPMSEGNPCMAFRNALMFGRVVSRHSGNLASRFVRWRNSRGTSC